MNCPKCDSTDYRKDGIVIGRQRYRCKECDYRYTVGKRSPRVPEGKKRFAIELYMDEMHSYIRQKKILPGLDCCRSTGKADTPLCRWLPRNQNGRKTVAADENADRKGRRYQSSEGVFRVSSADQTRQIESGDLHGRGIQQSGPPLSGQIQAKNQMLYEKF